MNLAWLSKDASQAVTHDCASTKWYQLLGPLDGNKDQNLRNPSSSISEPRPHVQWFARTVAGGADPGAGGQVAFQASAAPAEREAVVSAVVSVMRPMEFEFHGDMNKMR